MSERLALSVSTINYAGYEVRSIAEGEDAVCFDPWEARLLSRILSTALNAAEPYEYATINRLRDALEQF